MPDFVLTAHNLRIGYNTARRPPVVVAQDISVTLHAGELVCLIGPNGTGKSTLMRTLGGMQAALGGQVRLGDEDVFALKSRELARRMSIVLTERVDAGNLSAYALVALGRHPYTNWSGHLSGQDEAVVRWAIEAVGARELAHRPVDELSDGERQKIMIARALAQEPDVMLLDEPTAFLDLPNRVEVMRVLRHLTRTTGRAILLSTHDLDLALRSADTIWLMPLRAPLQVGAPEDLVLSGALEAAFSREGIVFDRQTGAFTILPAQTGRVRLTGSGLTALWTRRALAREGFDVAENGASAPVCVDILSHLEQPLWRVSTPGITQDLDSIYDLLVFLRQHPA